MAVIQGNHNPNYAGVQTHVEQILEQMRDCNTRINMIAEAYEQPGALTPENMWHFKIIAALQHSVNGNMRDAYTLKGAVKYLADKQAEEELEQQRAEAQA